MRLTSSPTARQTIQKPIGTVIAPKPALATQDINRAPLPLRGCPGSSTSRCRPLSPTRCQIWPSGPSSRGSQSSSLSWFLPWTDWVACAARTAVLADRRIVCQNWLYVNLPDPL